MMMMRLSSPDPAFPILSRHLAWSLHDTGTLFIPLSLTAAAGRRRAPRTAEVIVRLGSRRDLHVVRREIERYLEGGRNRGLRVELLRADRPQSGWITNRTRLARLLAPESARAPRSALNLVRRRPLAKRARLEAS